MSQSKGTGSTMELRRTGADRSPYQPLWYLRRADRHRSSKASLAAGSSALSPWTLAGLAVVAYGGWACPAIAQTVDGTTGLASAQVAPDALAAQSLMALPNTGPSQNIFGDNPATLQLAQANSGASSSQPLIPITAPNPSTNPFAAADDLKIRGYNIPFPFAVDTLDQGGFGLRNALASEGIGYTVLSSTTFNDTVNRHGLPLGNQFSKHSRDNQAYAGQLPTYTNQTTVYLTYDLRKYGIPDGQIQLAGQLTDTNWNPGGPDGFDLATFAYYQTLFNKKVAIKIGALNNALEFIGPNVGNSLANGIFGPNASLSIENGLDASAFTTYGVNVTYNFAPGFYDKADFSRAINPDGSIVEKLNNPTGTNLTTRNAGLIGLNEFGYKTEANATQKFTWVRAAADYSSGNYVMLDNVAHRGEGNYGLFFLVDRQILQTAIHPNARSGFRGIYLGISAEYAPEEFDRFSQYYEGRAYGFGLIPGRPRDLLSLVVAHNVFSEDAVQLAERNHLLAHHDVTAYTASYGIRIISGLNINLAAQFADHPTAIVYTRSTGSAFNLLANCTIFL